MARGKKPTSSQDSAQVLLDALREQEQVHQKKLKRRRSDKKWERWTGWLRGAPGWVKAVLVVLAVALVALIADGIRREGGEMSARLELVSGTVSLRRGGTAGPIAPRPGETLGNKDVLITAAGSTATLVFPDGSAVQLEPNTTFEVRLLDFARGGRRDRSFMVRSGAVVARFSRYFGVAAGSQGTVCTPTAVAAVRGTAFRVMYDPQRRQTYLAVVEGQVRFRTAAAETQATVGQMSAATGYQVSGVNPLAPAARTRIGAQVQAVDRFQRPPDLLTQLEYGINGALDPVMQLIGLAPGGWSFNATSAARRAAALKAFTNIRTALEGFGSEERPAFVNPVTLEELRMDEPMRVATLDAFSGLVIESYQKIGNDDYLVRARARDRDRTLYEMGANIAPRVIKE